MKIIDSHAHLGKGKYSNIDYYISEMDRYGIDKTIFCPGDMVNVVKMADYMRGKEPLLNYEPHNEWIKEAMNQYPERVGGFFMVDPEIHILKDVELALDEGFVGIKLNPLISKIDFTSEFIGEIFKLSADRRIPIYLHLTMNPKASIEALSSVVDRYEPVVIIGHMGFSSADWEAVELCRMNKDVYLETSVGSFRAIKNALGYIGTNKLIFGSEGPSHNAYVEMTKIKMLDLSLEGQEMIFHGNIERLLNNEKRG